MPQYDRVSTLSQQGINDRVSGINDIDIEYERLLLGQACNGSPSSQPSQPSPAIAYSSSKSIRSMDQIGDVMSLMLPEEALRCRLVCRLWNRVFSQRVYSICVASRVCWSIMQATWQVAAFQNAFHEHPEAVHLCLADRRLSMRQTRSLALFIRTHRHHLRMLILSGTMENQQSNSDYCRYWFSLAPAIAECTSLITLGLTPWYPGHMVNSVLSGPSPLRELNLYHSDLSHTWQLVYNGILTKKASLEELCLADCSLPACAVSGVAQLVRESEQLRVLKISSNPDLADGDWKELGEALGSSTSVTALDIHEIQLTQEHIDNIAPWFSCPAGAKKLAIADVSRPVTFLDWGDGLKRKPTLTKLCLTDVHVLPNGINMLADVLTSPMPLAHVSLVGINTDHRDNGSLRSLLPGLMSIKSLRHLQLVGGTRPDGMKFNVLQGCDARQLATLLCSIPLDVLSLGWSSIGNDDWNELGPALVGCTSLREVAFEGCDLRIVHVRYFVELLRRASEDAGDGINHRDASDGRVSAGAPNSGCSHLRVLNVTDNDSVPYNLSSGLITLLRCIADIVKNGGCPPLAELYTDALPHSAALTVNTILQHTDKIRIYHTDDDGETVPVAMTPVAVPYRGIAAIRIHTPTAVPVPVTVPTAVSAVPALPVPVTSTVSVTSVMPVTSTAHTVNAPGQVQQVQVPALLPVALPFPLPTTSSTIVGPFIPAAAGGQGAAGPWLDPYIGPSLTMSPTGSIHCNYVQNGAHVHHSGAPYALPPHHPTGVLGQPTPNPLAGQAAQPVQQAAQPVQQAAQPVAAQAAQQIQPVAAVPVAPQHIQHAVVPAIAPHTQQYASYVGPTGGPGQPAQQFQSVPLMHLP